MHYFETQVNKIDVIALLDEFNSSDNTRHTCLSTLILSLLQPHYAILDVIEPILHVQTPIHVYEMSMETATKEGQHDSSTLSFSQVPER
jgi:hypothetical protein